MFLNTTEKKRLNLTGKCKKKKRVAFTLEGDEIDDDGDTLLLIQRTTLSGIDVTDTISIKLLEVDSLYLFVVRNRFF